MSRFKTFLVSDRETAKRLPYTEERLRDWAMETFDSIDETSTLEDIARDMQDADLLLYEGIWPSVPDAEKSEMHLIAEAFQCELEAEAESIADALGTGLCVLTKSKTAVTEITNNKAVITTTVILAPRQPAQYGSKAGF